MRRPRPTLASETAKTKKIIKKEELENISVKVAIKDRIKVTRKNSNISKIIKMWEECDLILYKIEKIKNTKKVVKYLIVNFLKINTVKIKFIYKIRKAWLRGL